MRSGGSGISSSKIMERKDKERERRQQMKELCFKLSSLLPTTPNSSTSKDMMTQHDSLEEAAAYISELKQRVEKLRELRDSKYTTRGIKRSASPCDQTTRKMTAPPVIEVRSKDTNLEVVIVSGLDVRFELHRVIGILDEEGADVKNANVSVVGDRVFYTIHSQALSSRIGFEASRVLERLQDLVNS